MMGLNGGLTTDDREQGEDRRQMNKKHDHAEVKLGLYMLLFGITMGAYYWFLMDAPSSISADFRYYETYASMYRLTPFMSLGSIIVGVLVASGPVVRSVGPDNSTDNEVKTDGE